MNNKFKLLSILTVFILAISVFSPGSADAAGLTVVKSADIGVSWFTAPPFADTRTGGNVSFVMGPATAPFGSGSLQMTTTDANGSSQAKAQAITGLYVGTPLSSITALNYYVYRDSTSTNSLAQTISLNIAVDYVGDGSSFTTLVFEPVYQSGGVGAMQLNTWQLWDAYASGNAIWWSTTSIPGVCSFNCFVSWNTILASNPNAKVKDIFGFNVGSGWAGQFKGAADGLTIGVASVDTTYDFEPTPPDNDGPVTVNVVASPNPAAVNSSIIETANVDDGTTGGSKIASAEYSLDNGTTWSPTLMSAFDGAFDEISEDVTISFSAPSIPGIYDLCVRGTDLPGNTGAPECVMFVVYDPSGGFVTGGGWIDSPAGALAPGLVWNQGFETNTEDWMDANSSWHGLVTRVPSGTSDIASSHGNYHAVFEGDASGAPFSRFDGYRNVWPGTWTAEIDVYLDPTWASGTGFDYSVAANGSDGAHQRDYIFHVTKDTSTGRLFVAGSNNTNFAPRQDLENINHFEVSTAGWYTFQHVFRDQGGALAVDLNLLDANGNLLFTETRFNAADLIPQEVGGNRYSWFTFINVAGGIAVDEHQLFMPSNLTGKATFGFVSKYKKGASVPEGNTEFQFKAGDLNFHSTSYQWLVVNQAGTNAQFKGYGSINGIGNYGFMLWATDGSPDRFRILIWDATTEDVVYDNGSNQPIGGGSIVVHKK